MVCVCLCVCLVDGGFGRIYARVIRGVLTARNTKGKKKENIASEKKKKSAASFSSAVVGEI